MKTPAPDSAPERRIVVEPAAGTLTVVFNGKAIARTDRALALREGDYPPVHYIPLADVDRAALAKTAHRTHCPWKGDASYYTVTVGIESAENAVWAYEQPLDAVAAIAGHVAFYTGMMDSVTVG